MNPTVNIPLTNENTYIVGTSCKKIQPQVCVNNNEVNVLTALNTSALNISLNI